MEPEMELLLMLLAACAIAATLFYGGAFLIQRVKLLWIEIESGRIDMLAKRASVKMALDESDLKTQVIRLDENGLPPVSRKMVDAGMTTEAAFQIALAFIESQRTFAPTPTHLTYAPHVKNADALPMADAPQLTDDKWMVPSFHQLIGTDVFQPGRFLLGFSMENHSPVYGTWKDIYSCAIGGQPGTGKSTATRSLLAQSAMGGCKFVIVDPHFGAGEDSLGESLQPLRRAMLCDVASNDKATIDAVRYIDSIAKARMNGDKDRSPIMLVVDEATSLFSRSGIGDELTKLLEAVAQEYRKVGVFALCLGQIWTASRTGGDSGLRDSFASALVCKMKRSQARMLVPTEVAREVEILNIGQAILWKTSGDFARLAIPNCTQADIEIVANRVFPAKNNTSVKALPTLGSSPSKVLPESFQDDGLEVVGKDFGSAPEVIMDAKAQRAISMFLSGKTMHEILTQCYGVTGGRKYQEANAELQAVIRATMGGDR